jgi:SAM-dependent methyltransferase/GNAT superfamily N-acetyltransferase
VKLVGPQSADHDFYGEGQKALYKIFQKRFGENYSNPLNPYEIQLFEFFLQRKFLIEFHPGAFTDNELRQYESAWGSWKPGAEKAAFAEASSDSPDYDPYQTLLHEMSHVYDGALEIENYSRREAAGEKNLFAPYTGYLGKDYGFPDRESAVHRLVYREFRANLWANAGDFNLAYELTRKTYKNPLKEVLGDLTELNPDYPRDELYGILEALAKNPDLNRALYMKTEADREILLKTASAVRQSFGRAEMRGEEAALPSVSARLSQFLNQRKVTIDSGDEQFDLRWMGDLVGRLIRIEIANESGVVGHFHFKVNGDLAVAEHSHEYAYGAEEDEPRDAFAVWVDPAYEGRNLGSLLLQAGYAVAASLGVEKMNFINTIRDKRLDDFYERNAAVATGRGRRTIDLKEFSPQLPDILFRSEMRLVLSDEVINQVNVSDGEVRDILSVAGLIARRSQGTKLLDLGSGRGNFSVRAAEFFGAEVTGIEIDAEQLQLAQKAADAALAERKIRPGQIRFQKGDFLDEAVRFEDYDILYLFTMLSPAQSDRLIDKLAKAWNRGANFKLVVYYAPNSEDLLGKLALRAKLTANPGNIRQGMIYVFEKPVSSQGSVVSNVRLGVDQQMLVRAELRQAFPSVIAAILAGMIFSSQKAYANSAEAVNDLSRDEVAELYPQELKSSSEEVWVDIYQKMPDSEELDLIERILNENLGRTIKLAVLDSDGSRHRQDVLKRFSVFKNRLQLLSKGALKAALSSGQPMLVTLEEELVSQLADFSAEGMTWATYSGLSRDENKARLIVSGALPSAHSGSLAKEALEAPEARGKISIRKFRTSYLSAWVQKLSQFFAALKTISASA